MKRLTCILLASIIGVGLVSFLMSMAAAAQPADATNASTIKVPVDYPTIQAAIDAAAEYDTIQVQAGIYTENLSIRKGITLSGGWNSAFTASTPGDSAINADNLGRAISITCVSSDTVVTIDGFTIANGDASGLGNTMLGMDFILYPGQPFYHPVSEPQVSILPPKSAAELREQLEQMSVAERYPGGEAAYQAFLEQLEWRSQQAQEAWQAAKQSPAQTPPGLGPGTGGGVYSSNASLRLMNNTIENNLASQDSFGAGGGVYAMRAPANGILIENNIFQENQGSFMGSSRGGALFLTNAPGARIQGNDFLFNTASSYGDGYGGGAYITNSPSVVISSNTFTQNTGVDADGLDQHEGGGGALGVYDCSEIEIRNNLFEENTANAAWMSYGGAGGAVFLSRVDGLVMQDNLIEKNLAALQTGAAGGGVHLQMTEDALVKGNQFTQNWASLYTPQSSLGGGGLSLVDVYESSIEDNQVTENIAVVYDGYNSYGGGILGDRLDANLVISGNQVSANIACLDGDFGAGGGIQIGDSEDVTVVDNEISENTASLANTPGRGGGLLFRNMFGSEIIGNTFERNIGGGNASSAGSLAVDSLSGGNMDILIDSNMMFDNMHTHDPHPTVSGGDVNVLDVSGYFTFTNNVVSGVNVNQAMGLHIARIENASLTNNTFVQNGYNGVRADGATGYPTQLTMENNIVVSQTTGIQIIHVMSTTANYTLFHGNETDTNVIGSGSFTNTNPVYGDPAFADPQNNDFHLTITSAARESGNPAGVPPAPAVDADGHPRPFNQYVDLGAFELQELAVYLPSLLKQSSVVGWVVGDAVDNYGSILHTRDGGLNWVRQGTAAELPNVDLESVAVIDRLNVWVVGEAADSYGVILRTRDGGQSWQRQGSPSQTPDAGLLGIYALDGDTAWAVGESGTIVHTTDGGATWRQEGQGSVPAVMLQGVYTSDADNCWAVGSDHDGNIGTVLRTTDGGETWNEVNYTLTREPGQKGLIMMHGVDADTVWISGPSQISHTSDGGQTWLDQWFPKISFYHVNGVYALNAQTLWLAVDNGMIFRSDDGGYNYVEQDSGTFSEIMRIFALDDQRVWAVTWDLFPPFKGQILATTDGGETWAPQTTPIISAWNWVSFVK